MKNLYSARTAAKLCGYSLRHFFRIAGERHVEMLNFGRGKTKRFFVRAADIERLRKK